MKRHVTTAGETPGDGAGTSGPIRVLMGVPALGATAGGPALHLPMLVEDLRQRDDTEIVTMPYGRWDEGEPLPLKIWHQLVDVVHFPSRVRAADPDLVHLNTALDRRALLRDGIFVLLARVMAKRVVLKWHGSDTRLLEEEAGVWHRLARFVLHFTQGLCVLSNQEREEVERFAWAPRCFVVKNSIDPARYATRFDLHAQLGLDRGPPLLLFISRLIPAKGLEDVLRAVPPIVERHGAHLLVVGDGPSRRPAEALAATLGLQGAVHFLGTLPESEAQHFYNGADIFVFPSFHIEGFPMALFQSVVAGLGIVTTRLRAALDHLREPENCLFVEPRTPASITAALERLCGDRDLLERMRANNRLLARRFDRGVVAHEFANVYAEILKSNSRRITVPPAVAIDRQRAGTPGRQRSNWRRKAASRNG